MDQGLGPFNSWGHIHISLRVSVIRIIILIITAIMLAFRPIIAQSKETLLKAFEEAFANNSNCSIIHTSENKYINESGPWSFRKMMCSAFGVGIRTFARNCNKISMLQLESNWAYNDDVDSNVVKLCFFYHVNYDTNRFYQRSVSDQYEGNSNIKQYWLIYWFIHTRFVIGWCRPMQDVMFYLHKREKAFGR